MGRGCWPLRGGGNRLDEGGTGEGNGVSAEGVQERVTGDRGEGVQKRCSILKRRERIMNHTSMSGNG